MTSSLRDLKVYTTYPHSCSYLEEQEATTLFVDPRQEVDQTLYSNLSVLGFRRSGNHLYRPHCSNCDACIPARIPVKDFNPNRTQRRALRRNADLEVELTVDIRDQSAFDLYRPISSNAMPMAICTHRTGSSINHSSIMPGSAHAITASTIEDD